jgi:hypothetical protein
MFYHSTPVGKAINAWTNAKSIKNTIKLQRNIKQICLARIAALVLDGESEKQHMARVYIQVTAMEDTKGHFAKMSMF